MYYYLFFTIEYKINDILILILILLSNLKITIFKFRNKLFKIKIITLDFNYVLLKY
jgi:hypothetical protein